MVRQRGTSRLVKKEGKQLSKQAFKLIFFGTALLLLFIFVIMPNIIRLFFTVVDGGQLTDEADQIPPQTPILAAAPPEATASATLNFSGYAEPQSKVVFVLNSSINAEVEVAEDGQFSHELALREGVNELTLYGVDAAGNESLKTRSYQIERDTEAPQLEISEPTDGQKIELKKNQTLTVKGQTEVGARVTLNERLLNTNENGEFSGSFYLAEGNNELTFVSVDRAGNRSEKKLSVEFRF